MPGKSGRCCDLCKTRKLSTNSCRHRNENVSIQLHCNVWHKHLPSCPPEPELPTWASPPPPLQVRNLRGIRGHCHGWGTPCNSNSGRCQKHTMSMASPGLCNGGSRKAWCQPTHCYQPNPPSLLPNLLPPLHLPSCPPEPELPTWASPPPPLQVRNVAGILGHCHGWGNPCNSNSGRCQKHTMSMTCPSLNTASGRLENSQMKHWLQTQPSP